MEAVVNKRGRSFEKYFAVFVMSYREAMTQRASVYGRAIFLVALLLVFSALWKVVLAKPGMEAYSAADMIWYLTLTEWTLIATPSLHLDIEHEIRNGDVACRLPRPLSYLWTLVAEGMGKIMVRSMALALFGFAAAWVLAGGLPSNPMGLLYALPIGLLASCVALLGIIAIGLATVWLIDTSPVFWVWQKLSFVLGGLIFPLDIYPEWLVSICECTPFYAFLYGVGRLAYMPDPMVALESLGLLAFWGVVFFALCAWIYRRGLRSLTISGG